MLNTTENTPKIRCAIYTRKSVEDDYKKEVNSLEVQQHQCEKFIEVQATRGWIVSKVYEDYGKSGANLDRAGFQELLADIRADKIDTVVVYKLDRLTRSLRDFVSVIDGEFEKHGVSFASATEALDTSTPSGKMILSILIIFAQFEREQTRLRVKDNSATAKKMGIWMGGTTPIGFKSIDKKLVHDPVFAPFVQLMYQSFIETRSVVTVMNELNKKVALECSQEEAKHARTFSKDRIYRLLRCPLYKGYLHCEGALYKANHQAIIDEATWDQAQELLTLKPIKAAPERMPFDCAFKSKIRCKECDKAMVVTLGSKKCKKYPYYTCLRKTKGIHCSGMNQNIDAELVQRIVISELQKILKEPEMLGALWAKISQSSPPNEACKNLQNLDQIWNFLSPPERYIILQEFVHMVWLSRDGITIEFTANDDETTHVVSILGTFFNRKNKSQVFIRKEEPEEIKDPILFKALVLAEIWQEKINNGEFQTNEEIAAAYKMDQEYVRRGLSLTILSPKIKSAIINGTLHPHWRLQDFKRKHPPSDWREQEKIYLAA
ncbi:MAG: recombinase family protein [Holosporales bacterium]|nr:recombinase family protein [Holosporales bacterium]